jgi:methylenetetrahydrofolate dehydrogenase (NADP+) / methenyltetrahydrofolate cyclohydrolase
MLKNFEENKEKIISGTEIATEIKKQIKQDLDNLIKITKKNPKLVVILVGEDSASKVYVSNKHKTCIELGIESEVIKLDEETSQIQLLELIKNLNNDESVNGILVQLPLPKHINEEEILKSIHPLKDVDCFHPENIGLLFTGNSRFLPCTPFGIIEMCKYKNIDMNGKNVVIIGRSNIVGKPMAMLFLQNNATVTICHSKTKDISFWTKNADIIVVAIGKAKFLKKEMINDGAIIIDVGINRIDGKLYGDVDFEDVFKKSSLITPVPGGVGKMTIVMLMKNTISAYKIQNKI